MAYIERNCDNCGKIYKADMLNFLIEQATTNTEKVLYLLLREGTLHRDVARKYGIEHFRQTIMELRKRPGLVIINCAENTYRLCNDENRF